MDVGHYIQIASAIGVLAGFTTIFKLLIEPKIDQKFVNKLECKDNRNVIDKTTDKQSDSIEAIRADVNSLTVTVAKIDEGMDWLKERLREE
jgi:hypothetical protein